MSKTRARTATAPVDVNVDVYVDESRLNRGDLSHERGQALTEYALLVTALALALFTPVFPHPDTGERLSVVMWFVELFDIYFNSFHTVITLPIP